MSTPTVAGAQPETPLTPDQEPAAVAIPADWKGPASDKTFLGHPVGLFVLFFTEMWERFSYYGMRGLLKLYMVNFLFVAMRQQYQGDTQHLVPGDPSSVFLWDSIRRLVPGNIGAQASLLYGLYTGLVYLTPVFGGQLADRYFGQRKTVVFGGLLMAVGQFMLMVPGLFFPALFLLIIGNGAFKPNISTQVGNLYPPGDTRRDRAFTIFYMGINLGAFATNLACGTLAALFGWKWGFGAAGIGMLIGVASYLSFQKTLAPDNLSKARSAAEIAASRAAQATSSGDTISPFASKFTLALLSVDAIVAVGLLGWGIFGGFSLTTLMILLFCATAAFFVQGLRKAHPALKGEEWKAVIALVGLCALNVVFWAVYEQQGNTMQTWADVKTSWPSVPLLIVVVLGALLVGLLIGALVALVLVIAGVVKGTDNKTIGRIAAGTGILFTIVFAGGMLGLGHGFGEMFQIPSTWFQSANPLFIFMVAPVMDIFWAWQNRRKKEPSSVTKMAIGTIILGLSFIVMVVGAGMVTQGKGSPFWPLFCTFLLTMGELYLSPIGLSLVTKVSPARVVSMMMGMWFLSSFVGNYLSGFIGTFYENKTLSAAGFFWLLTGLGLATGALMFAFNGTLKKVLKQHA